MPDNSNNDSNVSHLSSGFSHVAQSRSSSYAPSQQDKNRTKISDPVIKKYWGTGSKSAVWIPLLMAIAFVGGWFVALYLSTPRGLSPAQQKLQNILKLIESQYVDDVNLDSLIEYTLPQLLNNLDPHSVYIPADNLEAVNDELSQSFSGIGVTFTLNNDSIIVLEVLAGGPAEKVGLQSGDRIIAIDGKTTAGVGITQEYVFKHLRGDAGTTVDLTILRSNSDKTYEYKIVRGQIPNRSVEAAYVDENGVGFVKITKFARSTYEESLKALLRLLSEGATSIVIDLRGNGGGLLDQALLLANEFLPKGELIMSQRGRDPSYNQEFFSDGRGYLQDIPLAVMIDEFTASASEIFAGAIQDNDRGVLIGRRSFGKGLIQNQITLPDSSAVRLTVARYYTPSGRSIQKHYTMGHAETYEQEMLHRYESGEMETADSIKVNTNDAYKTLHGRTVYGGGGIIPDVFISINDSTYATPYLTKVINAGLFQRYALEYVSNHGTSLSKAKTVDELLKLLPSDDMLLTLFVDYCNTEAKIRKQWAYINQSSPLIVNILKAMIARDILGPSAYYQIINKYDVGVERAIQEVSGDSSTPPSNKALLLHK